MARKGLSFRLLYRVIFVCLCVTVASFYSGGISKNNREEKSKEPRNVKEYEQFFRQQGTSPVTKNAEQVDGVERENKRDLIPKIARKGHVRKYENLRNFEKENINNCTLQNVTTTPRSDVTRNSSKLKSTTRLIPHQPLLLPSPEVKITRKGLDTKSMISHSDKIKRRSNDTKIISNTSFKHGAVHSNDFKGVVKGENFESFIVQHVQKRTEFNTTSESMTDPMECTYTFKIKYGDEYRIWNNFSMMYRDRMYYYDEYRVTDDGLELCNSSNSLIQNRWRNSIALEKRMMASKNCNVSVDISYWSNYILLSDFTVFFKSTQQNFTRREYGVIFGYFMICSAQLSLSCNDFLVKVTFDDQYNVWQNFSVSYNNKMYDYREYRVRDDGIEICSSSDKRIQTMWKNRNIMENKLLIVTCNGTRVKEPYVVDKKLNVYWTPRGKYLTRNDYAVSTGLLYICINKFGPLSTEFTEEDMSMCNDSVINIKHDDEFRVWKNFSILYKDKMYDYTQYRSLNDGITICNSTDIYAQNRWKLRNEWVKKKMAKKNCTTGFSRYYESVYTVDKQFNVYLASVGQYFARNEYSVSNKRLYICNEKVRSKSTEFTKQDMSMCNDSIINIKYDDEFRVWKNFSVLYKKKMYDYTEYRALNDGIKICNSTDIYVESNWKLRNYWVKREIAKKNCTSRLFQLKQKYYVLDKQFNMFRAASEQYFTRNEYGVRDNRLYTCKGKLRPVSNEFTKEDLLTCSDVIINIQYEEQYKVWKNFTILYKNKLNDYTEYRTLNDGIKICNSTDIYAQSTWKVRNYWVKKKMGKKNCTSDLLDFKRQYYTVDKQFNVYCIPSGQHFKRNDCGVFNSRLYICKEKRQPESSEFTKEDLLMCSNDIMNIQYEDKYKVWKNFTILYKDKMYDYTEYRALNDGIKICNSTDICVQNSWKLRNYWVKERMGKKNCTSNLVDLKRQNYTVDKQFNVYYIPSGQYFKRHDYGVFNSRLYICEEKRQPVSSEFTKEDLLMCSDDVINIKYQEKYKVWKNLTILYKDKMYDYTQYRALNDGIKICNSTDIYVQNNWQARNKWVKSRRPNKNCTTRARTVRLSRWSDNYDVISGDHEISFNQISYAFISIRKTKQTIVKNDFALIDGKFYKCSDELWLVSNSKHVFIFLGALAFSSICLLLLLIVYCMLPELRTLPGMNLMSLSISFVFANIVLIALSSENFHENKVSYQCALWLIAITFCSSSILTNAAVNVYHLRKTFSGNWFVKSTTNRNNLKLFLKYTVFSWGIPAILSIVEIIVVKVGLVSYSHDPYSGLCRKKYMYFALYIINELILPGCLILYNIVMFISTAYRIRQELNTSSNIAHKSNIMKNRRSFLLLLKLSTTSGLTWIPFLIFMNINFYPKVKMALGFITLLSGVYIAIAFVFTRKNYKLLKKKYFSES